MKKLVNLFTCASIILGSSSGIGQLTILAEESDQDTVILYEMDNDSSLVVDGSFSSKSLQISGSPEISIVEGDDETISLHLTGRSANYDAVDILREALQVNNSYYTGTYTFTVTGHVDEDDIGDASFVLSMTDSPWSELTSRVQPDSAGNFTLLYSANYGNVSDLLTLGYNYRIQTAPDVFTSFYIDNIVVTVTGGTEPDGTRTEVFSTTFDDKDEKENLFTVASSSSIEWANGEGVGMNDDYALRVTHIDEESYTSAYNAVKLTFGEPLPVGGVYEVSVWVYAPYEGNTNKSDLTGLGIVLNDDYAGSTGVSKFPSAPGTLELDTWTQLTVTLPVRGSALKSIDFRLVVNDAANHADVWLLDDIVITQIGDLVDIVMPEWDLSIDSLAEAYQDYFLFGNAVEATHLADEDTAEMYAYYYNAITAGNAMKSASLTTEKDKYHFDSADAIVNWAVENDIEVHGHTLVWHSQLATWLTHDDSGDLLTREEAKANMESYINEVAGRYAGKILSWDVVNEAFETSVTEIPEDWRDVLRNEGSASEQSTWYQAYANGAVDGESGADYIYDAFVFARLADPNATLYYNDFNETQAGKREAIAMMVEELNEHWKTDERNTDSDRLLIEGIGMQAHYWTESLDVDDVEASITRFVETGAMVSVSELDIPIGDYNNYTDRTEEPTEEELALQADLYAQLFELYIEYSYNIERISIWGLADPYSWRSEGYPLLFDKYYVPKEAYRAVMNVAENAKSAVQKYSVTVQSGGNGSAYANVASAEVGETVTISAAASSGYRFKEWQVVSGNANITNNSFSMPASDVVIKAVFEQMPAESYSVTVYGSYAGTTGSGSYSAGETVTIYAGTRSNYSFISWTTDDGVLFNNAKSNSTTFVMPEKDVNVTANWSYTGTTTSSSDDDNDDSSSSGSNNSSNTAASSSGTAESSVTEANKTTQVEITELESELMPYGVAVVSESGIIIKFDGSGYISGFTDGTVRPDDTVTRGQFAAMLYMLVENKSEVGGDEITFSDLNGDEYYYHAVMYFTGNSIFSGDPDGTFGADRPITRAEAATILSYFIGDQETVREAEFSDTAGHWAEQYILALADNGIISGYGDGTYKPDNAITRAEIITMINKTLGIDSEKVSAGKDNIFTDLDENHWAYMEILAAVRTK